MQLGLDNFQDNNKLKESNMNYLLKFWNGRRGASFLGIISPGVPVGVRIGHFFFVRGCTTGKTKKRCFGCLSLSGVR